MPKVTITGVGDVNFPDSMTPEQIQAAIEKDIAPKAQPSAPARLGPSQPLTFAEKFVAPALERMVGSNPQGSPAGRVIQGAADPMIGITQMAAHGLGYGPQADQRVADLEGQYQQQRAAAGSTGFDPMRMTGNVATAFLAPATRAQASGSMLAQMLRGGATGAAYNLAQPVTDARDANLGDLVTGEQPKDFWTEKGKQGGMGFGFGAAAVPAASMLARVVRPSTGANQQKLIDEGLTLTPGQTLGGAAQRIEDAMTSWPVVGDFVRDAKNRTLLDMQRATYRRALEPIGKADIADKLPAGPDGVLGVKTALNDAYDQLLPKLKFQYGSVASQLSALRQAATSGGLPKQEADQFVAILDKNIGQLRNGVGDGQTFKDITSNLGLEAKNFQGATDGYQRKLGDALADARDIFRQGLARSNPQYAAELAKIDEGWANFARIRTAAASAGDKSHGFTPAQLAAAVRMKDKTVDRGNTATGQALMQDLSDAARAVLPSTVADSGTPFRSAVGMGVGALAGHSVLPEGAAAYIAPMVAAGGLATLPYTQLGQKAAQAVLAQRPGWAKSVAALLRRGGPMAGAAAVPALTDGS